MKGTQASGVKRPALYWQGSKWRIAPWVISFFPAHRFYVEPFGGSAAVLLRKEPAEAEIYNDLNGGAVNFFRVLRDPSLGPELVRRCQLTPHAREEYDASRAPSASTLDDAVERARLFWVRSRLTVGSAGGGGDPGKLCGGFRYGAEKHNLSEAQLTASCADELGAISARLRRVIIEHIDALKLIPRYDSPETLYYVDPPYNASYSTSYAETLESHAALLSLLKGLQGFVVLSGYASELYADQLSGWHMEARGAWTFQVKRRTERLWLSPRTWEALQTERGALDA